MNTAFILNEAPLTLHPRGVTLPILTLEYVEPDQKEKQDGHYYAIRATHYKDNKINGIWEKTFWHRTPQHEAIDDMIEITNYFTVGAM